MGKIIVSFFIAAIVFLFVQVSYGEDDGDLRHDDQFTAITKDNEVSDIREVKINQLHEENTPWSMSEIAGYMAYYQLQGDAIQAQADIMYDKVDTLARLYKRVEEAAEKVKLKIDKEGSL